MIDDLSASGAGPIEIREMCRRWAAPSRRGLMGAGAGLVAGAAVQLLAGEAAAAGTTATLDQLKRAERDPNHRILLKGGMVLRLVYSQSTTTAVQRPRKSKSARVTADRRSRGCLNSGLPVSCSRQPCWSAQSSTAGLRSVLEFPKRGQRPAFPAKHRIGARRPLAPRWPARRPERQRHQRNSRPGSRLPHGRHPPHPGGRDCGRRSRRRQNSRQKRWRGR